MIVIIDYDMGNIGSIQNILYKAGTREVIISKEADVISKADQLILPGVGAFDTGMHNLQKHGLIEVIRSHAVEKKKPIFGICLGMQLLGIDSEEGKETGLNLIPFHTRKFSLDSQYKIPHMGWDYVEIQRKNEPIVNNLKEPQRYYFVHSFFAECEKEENVLMTCDYGGRFTSAVIKNHIIGFQFHPEKSHQFGLKLFKNFVEEYC